ncbi:MAG: sigma-54 dependent transcriptional regulator [Gammaproteobacteria bacterium]|nr:sigma-54 dependent transcriptional regulator [Gammaproteobacteria bacterium]
MSADYILVVDDEPDIRDLVKEILDDEGYEVDVAKDAASARAALRGRRPDLVLLDIWMPDTDGISLLKEWSEAGALDMPVLMMSGHGTVETAVEATRLGAYDFIEKPLSLAKLLLTVRRALEAARLTRENIGLRRAQPIVEPLGRSRVMQELRALGERVAAHDAPVLISGEPGSGKESIARYIHERGSRKGGPFIRVPVASLSNENSAVELFGAEDGAVVHFGSLERASGGTLYLEDVADMDTAIQIRLLGALQHQAFVRVGGVEPVQFSTRIVAATSHDLVQQVARGQFREELYYLLNVVPLEIPPLRDHIEDIPDLVEFFVDRLVTHESLPYRQFSVAGQNRLRNHTWPGNLRELQNVVQRLLILGNSATVEPNEIEAALGAEPSPTGSPGTLPGFDLPFKEARELFEKAYLEHQIQESDGNISRVASRIGIERTHLYRKLKALGVDPRQLAKR